MRTYAYLSCEIIRTCAGKKRRDRRIVFLYSGPVGRLVLHQTVERDVISFSKFAPFHGFHANPQQQAAAHASDRAQQQRQRGMQ